MKQFIVKRLAQMLFVWILVSMFSFSIIYFAPGDPLYIYMTPGATGHKMTDEEMYRMRESLGLNGNVVEQYVSWAKKTAHGNLGISISNRQPVLDQILEKLVGQKSGVNPNIFYLPATNDADDGYQGDYDGDFNRAIETANRLSEIDLLYIDDTPGLSLAQIVSESRRIKREKGCVGMILVDYLTLMTAEKADRNDLAYGMITKGLKNLAKELDCVVVLLTQLNRALESRTNKRPLPSDSRDTGQIEQDCDYWVGIHREGAFDDSVPPGETELILRLNRHGNTGTVYCIQANGAIYDTDQQSAEMRRREREEPQSKKKGGF